MQAALTQSLRVPRRKLLGDLAAGLGTIAATWLLCRDGAIASPYAGKATHFAARAKRVVQIFAAGGVSHIDTFDYKPDLAKHDGEELTGKGKVDTFFGQPGRLLKSPSNSGGTGEAAYG